MSSLTEVTLCCSCHCSCHRRRKTHLELVREITVSLFGEKVQKNVPSLSQAVVAIEY